MSLHIHDNVFQISNGVVERPFLRYAFRLSDTKFLVLELLLDNCVFKFLSRYVKKTGVIEATLHFVDVHDSVMVFQIFLEILKLFLLSDFFLQLSLDQPLLL